MHALFQTNALRAAHRSGNWHTATADCFADRGDYRPDDLYDRAYHNARFILNCRSLTGYLRSVGIHRQTKLASFARHLSAQHFINQAILRHNHFRDVLRHFAGRSNLIVVNIERPGAMQFVAERLGLIAPVETHHHKTRHRLSDHNAQSLQTAIDRLGAGGHAADPLLLHGRETAPVPCPMSENTFL